MDCSSCNCGDCGAYRIEGKVFIGMFRLTAATAKVETTAEATTTEVAACENTTANDESLAPARGEQVVGAHILLAQLFSKVQAH